MKTFSRAAWYWITHSGLAVERGVPIVFDLPADCNSVELSPAVEGANWVVASKVSNSPVFYRLQKNNHTARQEISHDVAFSNSGPAGGLGPFVR